MQVVNRILFTGSSDHTARSWVSEFGDCTRVYKGHKHTVSGLKYNQGIRTWQTIYFLRRLSEEFRA